MEDDIENLKMDLAGNVMIITAIIVVGLIVIVTVLVNRINKGVKSIMVVVSKVSYSIISTTYNI